LRSSGAAESGGYFIGVGSNAQPQQNIPGALAALAAQFGCLHASSIYLTEPVAVEGEELFRNLVLFLPVACSAAELKARCNAIETSLGRDRSHPQRKWIARPVDLDILAEVPRCTSPAAFPARAVAREPYFLVAVPELLHYLGAQSPPRVAARTEAVMLQGRRVGDRPFTLQRAAGGGIDIQVSAMPAPTTGSEP
jgi:2-amino-4-hydroxy-6-hydroxymethyldihydropteridine diphosphokinase